MHLTLQQDVTSTPAVNLRAQQKQFDTFRRIYNEQRPHAALEQKTPASCYLPSGRPYPTRLAVVDYPSTYLVRRLDQNGQFRFQTINVYTNRALAGEYVGLEPIADQRWRVYFSFYELGEFVLGETHVRPQPLRKEGKA